MINWIKRKNWLFPVRIGEFFQIEDGRGFPYNPIFKRETISTATLVKGFTPGAKCFEGRTFYINPDLYDGITLEVLIYIPGELSMRYHIRERDYFVKWTSRRCKNNLNHEQEEQK